MSKALTREELLAKRKAERAAANLLPPDEPAREPAEPPPGHPANLGGNPAVNGTGRHLKRQG